MLRLRLYCRRKGGEKTADEAVRCRGSSVREKREVQRSDGGQQLWPVVTEKVETLVQVDLSDYCKSDRTRRGTQEDNISFHRLAAHVHHMLVTVTHVVLMVF